MTPERYREIAAVRPCCDCCVDEWDELLAFVRRQMMAQEYPDELATLVRLEALATEQLAEIQKLQAIVDKRHAEDMERLHASLAQRVQVGPVDILVDGKPASWMPPERPA